LFNTHISNNENKRLIRSREDQIDYIARLAKRTMQFEGEGFYSGLGEFGEDVKEFNETLKEIMEYYKSKSGMNESRIVSFKKFKA
jgi:hypothetical protein